MTYPDPSPPLPFIDGAIFLVIETILISSDQESIPLFPLSPLPDSPYNYSLQFIVMHLPSILLALFPPVKGLLLRRD